MDFPSSNSDHSLGLSEKLCTAGVIQPGRRLSISHSTPVLDRYGKSLQDRQALYAARSLLQCLDTYIEIAVIDDPLTHLEVRSFHWGPSDPRECLGYRRSPRHPFPPAFELPVPQDLEYLIWEQDHERRRLRVLKKFKATHCKLTGNKVALERMEMATMRPQTDFRRAWKDGVNAARQLLSGSLPRELHTVLGIAQVASAIRTAVDDVDSPMASESKFLFDLGRWRQLLPTSSHAAFDCCADAMWEYRPPSDLAWEERQDTETLAYFQDLLMEMLSLIESSPLQTATLDPALPNASTISHPLTIAAEAQSLPSLPGPVLDEAQSAAKNPVGDLLSQGQPTRMFPGEVILYSAGAIFALILTFFMR